MFQGQRHVLPVLSTVTITDMKRPSFPGTASDGVGCPLNASHPLAVNFSTSLLVVLLLAEAVGKNGPPLNPG